MSAVKNPPEGYTSVTPYLTIDGAAAAIEFYGKAFGAVEIMRMQMGDRVGHAEIRVGNAIIMLADEFPEMKICGPKTLGGASGSLMVYLDNVDAAFKRAIDAGCSEDKPLTDQFWGDRMGGVVDPFGHKWMLATHVEDVTPDEMKRRMKAFAEQFA
ncbi:VOC family protein [Sphingomonas crocodyli]|uniref:VOC family protein n=1 Tax=Sphingomonas crocodyli TaxID=1979270 RepID=A0A437LVJ1_9SPHN|nr:VOC family protein [Sphingomonas crocodyli]RVT89412.1 VOC family protein [Sphingomonas crocodyli]